VFPGDAVGGRFLIEEQAASGGMATVYRARDRLRGGAVAVKVLHGQGRIDVERLAREAALLAELAHPGIVGYVAHGATEQGAPFLAMEWLEGETLQQRFAAARAADVPARMPVAEAVRLARRVAEALAVAHRRSVVHRDIKPGNIFLPGGDVGRAKLVDFGIARHTRRVRELTQTGTLIGTPGYMAPEQARGIDDVDPRADVFALGCVLYECLTGQPAFVAEQMIGLLAKILLDEVPPLRELVPDGSIPARLDALVGRMLAKEPDDRPADACVLELELQAIAAGVDGLAAGSPAPVAPPPRALGRAEQRILCVLLVQDALPRGPDGEAPTVRLRDLPPQEEALRAAVLPFGGRLEPVVDGSVAVTISGAGTAMDQAAAAARSALALRRLLPDAPVAVATGRAVLTSRLPAGEAIDRAVRLLSAPRGDRPPAILLDDVTAGLLGSRFEVAGDDGGLTLRGELEEETARTVLGKPTPFIGRERELGRLLDTFRECAAEPVARAVLVTAAAGAGKSRLRYELCRRVVEERPGVEILVGRGESVAAGAPFGMLAPAIRRLCGIVDGEPLGVRRRRLRARLGRHLGVDDALRACDFIGEMVGVPFPDERSDALRAARRDPKLMGDAMRGAWQDWLAAECAAHPVLIVLEDLHWGDLPSVKLVDAALRNLADRPLLVLALARPDVHAQFPQLWAERPLEEIRLAPLTRRAAERLAAATLGDAATPDRLASVVELADGNPFYLEELIRGVAAGASSLPVTVLGMVQARLDALDDETRRVLRAASVFGERFWRGGVAALAGERELEPRLDELVDRELIVRRVTATLPDERELVFRHALVREAAYASLTSADRALGHRLAGAWLERVAGGDDAALGFVMALAQHYDLGGEPDKARRWYRRGAEQALEGHDLPTAISRAGRAIACGAAGETLGALRLLCAEAHAWRGERQVASSCADEACRLLPRGAPVWFRAAAEAIEARCMLADVERASALAREVSEVAVGAGADARVEKIACLSRAALVLLFAGQSAIVSELGAQLDGLAGAGLDLERRVLGRLRELRALEAYYAGDPEGNLVGLEAAHAAYQAAGDARGACQALAYIGFAHLELGCFHEAEQALERARADAERLGLAHVLAVAWKNLGLVAAARGDLDEARRLEERAAAVFAGLGVPRMEGAARRWLALLACQTGDALAAEREARRAIELLEAAPPKRVGAHAALGRALLLQGRVVEALDAARAAVELAARLGVADESHTLAPLVYAEALTAAGHVDEAREVLLAAREALLERAGRITDESLRRSFLAVPENARVLELARDKRRRTA
jgi:tetratricopeptide (TPR) repeat protein